MTEQSAYTPPPAQPKDARPWYKKKRFLLPIGAVALLTAYGAGAGSADDTTSTSASSPSSTTVAGGDTVVTPTQEETTAEPVEEPAPAVYNDPPSKKDFSIRVKTTGKECFGSAGCLVDFKVKLSYSGTLDLDPDKTYDITYDIRGAEDPYTATLEASGDTYSVPAEENISTTSSASTLRAVITDVEEQ